MNEEIVGIIVLLALSTLTSILVHYLMSKRTLAVVLSALLGSLLFQFLVYLNQGHLDPFILITFVTSFFIIVLISWLVSIPFSKHRRETTD